MTEECMPLVPRHDMGRVKVLVKRCLPDCVVLLRSRVVWMALLRCEVVQKLATIVSPWTITDLVPP
jgi:hypothetical protein